METTITVAVMPSQTKMRNLGRKTDTLIKKAKKSKQQQQQQSSGDTKDASKDGAGGETAGNGNGGFQRV